MMFTVLPSFLVRFLISRSQLLGSYTRIFTVVCKRERESDSRKEFPRGKQRQFYENIFQLGKRQKPVDDRLASSNWMTAYNDEFQVKQKWESELRIYQDDLSVFHTSSVILFGELSLSKCMYLFPRWLGSSLSKPAQLNFLINRWREISDWPALTVKCLQTYSIQASAQLI